MGSELLETVTSHYIFRRSQGQLDIWEYDERVKYDVLCAHTFRSSANSETATQGLLEVSAFKSAVESLVLSFHGM